MGTFDSVVKAVLASGGNRSVEICRLDDLIFEGVGDVKLARHITQKCARAIVEGRITEGAVFGCVANARSARNRGAYFVASVKRQFAGTGLPWRTEEWQD